MKTNTIQIIATAVVTGLIAGIGSTSVTGNFLTGLAVAVSSWAVVALLVIATSDYRSGSKAYFAAPVTKGHFKQTAAPVALRDTTAKAA